MKLHAFILLVASLFTMSSCTVTKMSRYNEVAYRNLEPKQDAIIVPLKGEIEVLKDTYGDVVRIKGESTKNNTDLQNGVVIYHLEEALSSYAIQEWKKRAVNEVAKFYNADLIVGALVDVEYNENFKADKNIKNIKAILSIKISGYPAKFTKFKNLEVSDPAVLDYYVKTTNLGDLANQLRHEMGIRR